MPLPDLDFGLAATHLHFARRSERGPESLDRGGRTVQHRDPAANGLENNDNHAHDKDGHQD